MTGAPNYAREYFERGKGLDDAKYMRDSTLILELLNPQPNEKILDIGCGLGRLSYRIAQFKAEVTGIDISEYAISQARHKYGSVQNLKFIQRNALETSYENCFDKVLCYHLLEHLKLAEARILLGKICSALRREGLFVLGIPINDFKPYRQAIRLLATGRRWRDLTHQTSFSVAEIERELTSAGFELLETVPLSYFGIRLPHKLFSTPLLAQVITACADIRAIRK